MRSGYLKTQAGGVRARDSRQYDPLGFLLLRL
jgi:hypothetical protein